MKISPYFGILLLGLFVFSCDSDENITGSIIPESDKICENNYDNIYGNLISCDSDCINISGECYLENDINSLIELKTSWNPFPNNILTFGDQSWSGGRLIEFQYDFENFSDNGGWVEPNSNPTLSPIVNLTGLKKLFITKLDNVGQLTFPSEIVNLTNLNYLWLTENQLTGEIPSEIGNLTNLTTLILNSNQLSGEIPSEIGNLTNLTDLSLGNNQLTGGIPVEIGNLINLDFLGLNKNQLSGEIPEGLCIFDCNLSENQLCPPYPECIHEGSIDPQDTSNCGD